MDIKIAVMNESGHEMAMLGRALSYYDRKTPMLQFWTEEKYKSVSYKSVRDAHRGGGHNAFLKQMHVWVLASMPRYFWIEMDTYKVGRSNQSSSTMHVLNKRPVDEGDFVQHVNLVQMEILNRLIESKVSLETIKANLPEGYFNERMECYSYMCLQNIIKQRRGHRVALWDVWIDNVLSQVEHPEYLITM